MPNKATSPRAGTPRAAFASHAPSSADWETAFASPGKATLRSIAVGKVGVRLSGMVDLEDEKAEGLADAKLEVPVYAHLVRHEAFGDVLVDAGLDRGYIARRSGSVRGLAAPFLPCPGFLREEEELGAALKALGARPSRVFYTHLHFDHCAGALDLGSSIRHIVGAGEREFGVPLFAVGDFLRRAEALEEMDFSSAAPMPILGACLDLLGDGSLWAFPTPGHSAAHVSYLFNGEGGPALLAGDAVSMRVAAEKGLGPGKYSADRQKAKLSSGRILAFCAAYPALRLICGHELS